MRAAGRSEVSEVATRHECCPGSQTDFAVAFGDAAEHSAAAEYFVTILKHEPGQQWGATVGGCDQSGHPTEVQEVQHRSGRLVDARLEGPGQNAGENHH